MPTYANTEFNRVWLSNNFFMKTLQQLDSATNESSSTASSLGTVAAAAAPGFLPGLLKMSSEEVGLGAEATLFA
jgi:hypothetical protein